MACRTSIARRSGDEIESVDSFQRLRAEFGSAALSCEEDFCGPAFKAGGGSSPPFASANGGGGGPGGVGAPPPASPMRLPPSSAAGRPSLSLPPTPAEYAPSAAEAVAAGVGRALEARLGALEETVRRELAGVGSQLAAVSQQAAHEKATLERDLAHERAMRDAAEQRLREHRAPGSELRGLTLALGLGAAAALGAAVARSLR